MWQAAAAGGVGFLAWAVRGRSATVLAPSDWHGPRGGRSVALTFDDGPSESTPDVLRLLERYRARATFFVCGQNAERLPDVLRQAVAEGHELGNHTWSHRRLDFCPRAAMKEELRRTQDAIESHTGTTPRRFRAPYGVRWFGLGRVQSELGLRGVMWTRIGLDWKNPGRQVAARLLRGVQGGDILCLHDGRELQTRPDIGATLGALEEMLPRLRDLGFQYQTVSAMLEK